MHSVGTWGHIRGKETNPEDTILSVVHLSPERTSQMLKSAGLVPWTHVST